MRRLHDHVVAGQQLEHLKESLTESSSKQEQGEWLLLLLTRTFEPPDLASLDEAFAAVAVAEKQEQWIQFSQD